MWRPFGRAPSVVPPQTRNTPSPGGGGNGGARSRPTEGPDTDEGGASPFDLGPLEGPGSLWKLPQPGRNAETRSDLGR